MNDDVISIFSGAGGLSFGFIQAGLKPVFGIDINQDACQTYQLNLNSDCYQLDLGDEDQSKVRHLLTPYKNPLLLLVVPHAKDLVQQEVEIGKTQGTGLSLTISH
ncbi:MAG: hypothetical protein HC773_20390 [Scytonema sp. CRU_2_7]|nr:hypothetical protein [Scytonema sp. CRU_2_7]